MPFEAVVGQDVLKLALLLAAIDPLLGGVLLRGEKGSGKTTLARGLAGLLPGDAPFVELPLGATEDRLIGTLDLTAALTQGERRFEPGLLAAANGGVLYVDEVNLLSDHLVDVLLDVATSGINRVEREGISYEHPARFVLVGSMNPEEGELRPQLLDRFGLAVDVTASTDPQERAEAVRRRLAFDADPVGFTSAWKEQEDALRSQLATSPPASVPNALLEQITGLCAALGAQGLRADLVLCRAVAALASLESRSEATPGDVRRIAPLALAHRQRRTPFEQPGLAADTLGHALDDALDRPRSADDAELPPDQTARADPPQPVGLLEGTRTKTAPTGRRSISQGDHGRLVGDRAPDGPLSSVAVAATVRQSAVRRIGDPDASPIVASDLREPVREERAGTLLVLVVDASGSMGVDQRMEAVKGATIGLLIDAYQRRDRVALITFRNDHAEVVLRPTSSIEVARARLEQVPTGGRTPLAAGLEAALQVATSGKVTHPPLLVLLSDGRATSAPDGTDPVHAAHAAAQQIRAKHIASVVIDAETGDTRLGLARELADTMGARYLTLPELSAGTLERSLRSVVNG